MTDVSLSRDESRACAEAGVAVYAGRLILDAQPPAGAAALAAVAERCAGPLPAALVDLWRTTFGGRLCYDLRAEIGGADVAVAFRELFHPGSDGYQDLWGWIAHERELASTDRVDHLPIGGFEYLDRIYVATAPGPGHGAVACWQQGLPAGWELTEGDRAARIAADLPALFARLVLESDPWEAPTGEGADLRDAVDELSREGDPRLRGAAGKLRRLVTATVLDWRGALRAGTLAGQPRLRRLALERAAAGDDLALLRELVGHGCDPAEPVRDGLTPIDVALAHGGFAVVRWLLDRGVPVGNTLRAGARSAGLELAGELMRRGATVDASAVGAAVHNPDVAVVDLLAGAVRPGAGQEWLVRRLRGEAARAAAGAGEAGRRRAEVLDRVADRFEVRPSGP